MSKGLTDLREHLFATLDALRDKENPMDIDRARAVSEVAKQLIDTAKVEVEYLRVAGGGESEFIDTAFGASNVPESARNALPPGITGVHRHRLQG